MDTGHQEANLNAGHHLNIEELNELHPLWSKELPQPGYPEYKPHSQKVYFSKETWNRDEANKDGKEKTDFLERGDRPLCKALKLIEAAEYNKPIYQVLMGEKDKFMIDAIDIIIGDTLESLIKGYSYQFNNASSTKVRPSPAVINRLKVAYVKFRYFTDLPPLKDCITTTQEKKMELLKVQPIVPPEPLLVRQASRSIYCAPPPVDDLEARYLKLLGR